MEYLSFDEKDPNAEFPKAYANAQAKYESSKFKGGHFASIIYRLFD